MKVKDCLGTSPRLAENGGFGAQVTYNYQFESFGDMRHRCYCNSDNCSGFLGACSCR